MRFRIYEIMHTHEGETRLWCRVKTAEHIVEICSLFGGPIASF